MGLTTASLPISKYRSIDLLMDKILNFPPHTSLKYILVIMLRLVSLIEAISNNWFRPKFFNFILVDIEY